MKKLTLLTILTAALMFAGYSLTETQPLQNQKTLISCKTLGICD